MPVPAESPESRPRWGDYLVAELLSEGTRTRTYRADQVTVRRTVVLEQLKPEAASDPGAVEAFLADVRAKAAVRHAGIGSVYEAVQDGGQVFYTREWLDGESLEDLYAAGRRFPPAVVVRILRQAAEALAHLEECGAATLPLEVRHLVLAPHEVLRLVNLAVADVPDPRVARHDRHLVAELLLDCLEDGAPGAGRTEALLNDLGSNRDEVPDWASVARAAARLGAILESDRAAASQRLESRRSSRRGPQPAVVAGTLVLLGALALVAGGLVLALRDRERPARLLNGMVAIPGRDSPAARPFLIDAEEVTIAEYAEFLAALALIDPAHRDAYDHPDQPPPKESHVPADWDALHAAARSGGRWEGLRMDPNCPVVNVDWWDAYAFADWRGGRLPTEAEWAAAAQGADLASAGWGVVDASPGDRTPAGVHGLAGNVAEWVRDPSRNPAFPMNPRKPVACGASFRDPANGVRARLWLPSRESRRPDLGFRVLRETAPGPGA